MCCQVEVLELQDDKAIITVGESKFVVYHDTEVEVSEGFDDCWSYSVEFVSSGKQDAPQDSHNTQKSNGYQKQSQDLDDDLPF